MPRRGGGSTSRTSSPSRGSTTRAAPRRQPVQ